MKSNDQQTLASQWQWIGRTGRQLGAALCAALLLTGCPEEGSRATGDADPVRPPMASQASGHEAPQTPTIDDFEPDRTEWMAMLLNGTKTGYMKLEWDDGDNTVATRETVVMSINRGDAVIEMKTVDTALQAKDGRPLAFRSSQQTSNTTSTIAGSIVDDRIKAVVSASGNSRPQTLAWPDGAVFSEGLRWQILERGLTMGDTFSTTLFLPGSLQAVPTTITIGERETVDLFGIESALTRVEQVMDIGGTMTHSTNWVTDDYQIKKMRLTLAGMLLESIACPEACALADSQPTTFFVNTFAEAPRRLSGSERSKALRYTIRPRQAELALSVPESAEQQVSIAEDGTINVSIQVNPQTTATVEPSPSRYLSATRWLQSDTNEVIELAKHAAGEASESINVMRQLEQFVAHYVDEKSLAVGYASALEVVRDRSGDCTEHAVLLAALGRARGIPTRIATGLAYVDSWLGAEQMFVPHAWTQALIDGRWVSFDASLGQFSAGHIALAYGEGDPFGFFSSVNSLGNIDIEKIEALP